MTKSPSIPPDQRSPKGRDTNAQGNFQDQKPQRENFDQQGRQGNIRQNTRNQGYQQDR